MLQIVLLKIINNLKGKRKGNIILISVFISDKALVNLPTTQAFILPAYATSTVKNFS